MKPIIIRMNVFLLSLLLIFPTAFAKSKSYGGKKEKIDWVQDGVKKTLVIKDIELKDYFPVGELAQLSGSQLHWRTAADEACLTKFKKELCFNWKESKDYRLIGNDLYIPFKVALSKTFQKFSGTDISWNSRKEILEQDTPVNLVIPAVENLGDRYRLRLDVTEKAPYRLLEKSPRQIWVRFVHGRTTGSSILEGDGIIKEVRINQKRRSADLVLKMGKNAKGNDIFYDTKTNKLVLDVFKSEGAVAALTNFGSSEEPVAIAPVITATKKYKPVSDKSVRTIVIDPGHGGEDSGAVGTRGTYEKDINLKVAKAIAKRLESEDNTRVILTRDKDVFVPLSERTRIANEAKADLFVSIHCNSSLSAQKNGFEVYVMALEASDKAAAAVARIENSVVELETKSKHNSDKLTYLLASMAVNNYFNESSECSSHITRAVKGKSPVKNTAVLQANFHVLRGAQMPAVLVELGYLSNPVEELKLRSSRYRSLLVNGIQAGILSYDHTRRRGNVALVEASQ